MYVVLSFYFRLLLFEKAEHAFSNPRHVAIVVNFFFRDYVTFQIPLPTFAVRSLEALHRKKSPLALSLERLEVLMNITQKARAVSR